MRQCGDAYTWDTMDFLVITLLQSIAESASENEV